VEVEEDEREGLEDVLRSKISTIAKAYVNDRMMVQLLNLPMLSHGGNYILKDSLMLARAAPIFDRRDTELFTCSSQSMWAMPKWFIHCIVLDDEDDVMYIFVLCIPF
jgi:hypothetical protein